MNPKPHIILVVGLLSQKLKAYAGAHTPEVGSAERKGLMDFLRLDFYARPYLAESNPGKILFKVYHLKVAGDWACVCFEPTRDGKAFEEPRWKLLKRRNGQWTDLKYFESLKPMSEEEAEDALDMTRSTIKKLQHRFPEVPQDIFPKPDR